MTPWEIRDFNKKNTSSQVHDAVRMAKGKIMSEAEKESLYTIDVNAFEHPEAYNETNKYAIEQGMYTAVCVGYTAEKHIYEGQDLGNCFYLIWQLNNKAGTPCTLKGNRWKISSNEKANFRKDLEQWFHCADWAKIVDTLVKGNIIDKKTNFVNMVNFIGKKATLMITEELAKNGRSYPRIVSLSPADKNVKVEVGGVPQWMFRDALDYKLMKGVEIEQKAATATSGEADAAPAASSGQPNAAAAGIPDNAVDLSDLPF